jgi:hypothetical protein
MLLHAGNNALGVLAGSWLSLEALHWDHFAAATADIFAVPVDYLEEQNPLANAMRRP